MSRAALAGSLLAALCLSGCGPPRRANEISFNLPAKLTEVSGLAAAGPDSVFTHEDEHAIVYEIRLRDGHVTRAFALGNPTIEDDFEGIATADGQVFLVTSDGLIYAARPGEDGQRVPFRVYDSGVGPRCEVEGLSQAPVPDALLLLCKRFRDGRKGAWLEIYLWRVGQPRAEEKPWLSLPLEPLLDKKARHRFWPSGIEWDAARRRLLIVSARNHMEVVLDEQGRLLEQHMLNGTRHPKTEGIAIMPDGRLVMADEGAKTREGRLTVYRKP